MSRFRIALLAFAVIVIVVHLTMIDYADLRWSNNSGSYFGIAAMACVIASLLLSRSAMKKDHS